MYNDGSGKIREVSSKEELDYYLSISPDKNKVKIWLYHSSSWVSYQDYLKSIGNRQWAIDKVETAKPVADSPKQVKEETILNPYITEPAPPPVKEKITRPPTVTKPLQIILNICIVLVVAGGVYAALFYNTKEWTDPRRFETKAPRPANMPDLNMDSLIQIVEGKDKRTQDK